MATKVPYQDRKEAIRQALKAVAQQGETITYGELGRQVGIPPQGPWKPVLDEIAGEKAGVGKPDLTYLVVNSRTGYSGQIGFEPAKPPSEEQIAQAKRVIEMVCEHYRSAS